MELGTSYCFEQITIRSFPHSWMITGFVTRVTRRVEKELLTLPKHPSSPSDFSEVRVARFLVFCVVFCRSLFVFLSFIFWAYVSIYCTPVAWLTSKVQFHYIQPLCFLSIEITLLIVIFVFHFLGY